MSRNVVLTDSPDSIFFRYDSVIYTGQVRWQNRLNAYNLPFFLPSTGLFTNYSVSAGTHGEYVDTQRSRGLAFSGHRCTHHSPLNFSRA